MAIFTSPSMQNGGLPVQASCQGIKSITTKIVVPSGTAITAGDVFVFNRLAANVPVKSITLKTSDLDTGTAITGDIGYIRATVDPRKAFNATTNPYLTGAVATADPDAYAATATIQGTLRTGGMLTVNNVTLPADGVADVALTIGVSPTGDPATERTLELTVEYIGFTQEEGEFSGLNTYDYLNDTANV